MKRSYQQLTVAQRRAVDLTIERLEGHTPLDPVTRAVYQEHLAFLVIVIIAVERSNDWDIPALPNQKEGKQ